MPAPTLLVPAAIHSTRLPPSVDSALYRQDARSKEHLGNTVSRVPSFSAFRAQTSTIPHVSAFVPTKPLTLKPSLGARCSSPSSPVASTGAPALDRHAPADPSTAAVTASDSSIRNAEDSPRPAAQDQAVTQQQHHRHATRRNLPADRPSLSTRGSQLNLVPDFATATSAFSDLASLSDSGLAESAGSPDDEYQPKRSTSPRDIPLSQYHSGSDRQRQSRSNVMQASPSSAHNSSPHDPDSQRPPLMHLNTDVTYRTPSRYSGTQPAAAAPLHLISPSSASNMFAHQDGLPRSVSDNSLGNSLPPSAQRKLETSPSKFSTFFGWRSSPPKPDSHIPRLASLSEDPAAVSTFPVGRLDRSVSAPRLTPMTLDMTHLNVRESNYLATPLTDPAPHSPVSYEVVEELERELKEITEELAGSIRREMELEDELDRTRLEHPITPHTPGDSTRRTSDYYSDSGESSTKYSVREGDSRLDELEKSQRKVEQEKATIKADFALRLANEQRRRRELELEVARLQSESGPTRDQAGQGSASNDRIRELEMFLEDSRRRWSQERESRDNLEDLLGALRTELVQYRNERDNLRDEVIPQLKARIEGLEAEAAEASKLRYDNTSMERELHRVQSRNHSKSIAEDPNDVPFGNWSRLGNLGRSNSVAHSERIAKSRDGPLSRSGSIKGRNDDTISGDRVKDIEDQRDALQKALKQLVRRNEHERREHAKQIQSLLAVSLQSQPSSPVRSGFSRDVRSLRDEIGTLRKRADEATIQKWQCENNLRGVKLALDRAEQETRSLRSMLEAAEEPASPVREHDDDFDLDGVETPTLDKSMRGSIGVLRHELASTDQASKRYRKLADALGDSSNAEDRARAEQLVRSAGRMESLAGQAKRHLDTNEQLRQRLTSAVGKGEREQSNSAARIIDLQSRLKALEDGVTAAQTQSESTLAIHEEEARQLTLTSPHLHRLQLQIPSSTALMANGKNSSNLSPRTTRPSRVKMESLLEASKTTVLHERVRELEQCLTDADTEMKSVVHKTEQSKREIAQLQGDWDEAMRQLRKLQIEISREKQKVQPLLR